MQLTMTIAAALLAAQQVGTISPGGMEAIGPKQDDPRAMCDPEGTATTGMLDAGRVRTSSSSGKKPTPGGIMAIGPKQDDPRSPALAIGPKQDDPSRPGAVARPGDDEDPKAAGGNGMLAIGPKQDDPRAPAGLVARPGDDEDPQALALAQKCEKAGR